jgi:hypothetical protein
MSRDLTENQVQLTFFHRIFVWGDRFITIPATVRIALVELVGNDRVLDQKLEGDDLEGILVRSLEDNRAGGSGLLDLQPARGTDAPAIAGFEAGETELGHGRAEVVAQGLGGGEKRSIDDTADGMDAMILGAGFATACAVETGHRFATADVERLAEDVLSAILDGLDSGHQ